MFQLTIQAGNQSWPFLFKDKQKAEEAHKAALSFDSMTLQGAHGFINVSDDFGRIGRFHAICGVIFEDLEQSMFANIALAIHQTHTQIKYASIARNDPVIKAAQQMQGPGIISPVPGANGMGFRN